MSVGKCLCVLLVLHMCVGTVVAESEGSEMHHLSLLIQLVYM